jgi:hypothetical protein
MKSLEIVILALITIVIFYCVITNIRQIKQNTRFLFTSCKKGYVMKTYKNVIL